MSGIRNSVQALMKAEVPKALYVHCLAYNLNLVLKDVTNVNWLYSSYAFHPSGYPFTP